MADLSFSLFGFVSSLLLPLHHMFMGHHHTSPLPLSLQLSTSYSTERNYIFIFCNCILAFLITISAFAPNSHLDSDPTHVQDHTSYKNVNFSQSTPPPEFGTCETKLSPSPPPLISQFADDDQQQVDKCQIGQDEREEDHDDDEDQITETLMNVDELNKKCEEFIKKMKEQIGN